jgi:exosortase
LNKRKRSRKPAVGRESLEATQRRHQRPGAEIEANSVPEVAKKPKTAALQNAAKMFASRERPAHQEAAEPLFDVAGLWSQRPVLLWALAIVGLVLFAYWPTLVWLESQWRAEDDYSHGYIVLPLAIVLLWIRWDSFPGVTRAVDWRGLYLIGLAVAMRVIGRLAYMDFMDGWSIVPLVGGMVWLLLGWPAARWAAPAIAFLIMMVPLPYRAESLLSWKLQGVATTISTGMLRILGQPAIAEGHTIWIGETQLQIEEACSGLRIFVGLIALAFFWAVTAKRSWLDRLVILAAALPMALLVNSLRIVATGILFGWFNTPESRHIIHDWSGYLMIPLAAGLLWIVKIYWEHLYRPVVVFNPAEKLQDPGDPSPGEQVVTA